MNIYSLYLKLNDSQHVTVHTYAVYTDTIVILSCKHICLLFYISFHVYVAVFVSVCDPLTLKNNNICLYYIFIHWVLVRMRDLDPKEMFNTSACGG